MHHHHKCHDLHNNRCHDLHNNRCHHHHNNCYHHHNNCCHHHHNNRCNHHHKSHAHHNNRCHHQFRFEIFHSPRHQQLEYFKCIFSNSVLHWYMYGCSQTLKPGDSISPPPHDMAIVSRMVRSFFLPSSREKVNKEGNVYFHLNSNCVHMKQPYFIPSMLIVPSWVAPLLVCENVLFLRQFGVQI